MSAIDTFRRAMRRHEKRARRMGAATPAELIRASRLRLAVAEHTPFAPYALSRRECKTTWDARVAFLYERAAEAVARLQASR